MFLRPTTSEVVDQMNRPSMLASDRMATKPAAVAVRVLAGVSPLKKSW